MKTKKIKLGTVIIPVALLIIILMTGCGGQSGYTLENMVIGGAIGGFIGLISSLFGGDKEKK